MPILFLLLGRWSFCSSSQQERGNELVMLTAHSSYRYEKNVVGFEKELGAVKVIKEQIQYRSQSLLNLACGYFSRIVFFQFLHYTCFSNAI